MELKKLIEGLPIAIVSGPPEAMLSDLTQDSRAVKAGSGFFAIQGFQMDGHRYIAKAIEQGAQVIFCADSFWASQPEVAWHNQVTVATYPTDMARPVLSKLAAAINGHPSKALTMVGLTGTNGKTSTARLISNALVAAGYATGVLGTIQNQVGEKVYASKLTTPEPLELHSLLREMVKDNMDACVMEASSHALALDRVSDIAYDIGVFTNLTKDHLDFHEDFESYYQAKKKLFQLIEGVALINTDDPYGRRLYDELQAERLAEIQEDPHKKGLSYRCQAFGLGATCDFQAVDIGYSATGSSYTLKTPTYTLDVQVPIPGEIYVYNTLAALAVLYSLDPDPAKLTKAIEAFEPVPGRMEPVANEQGLTVLVDYAHTGDALKNALTIVKDIADKQVYVVFGCGGDRDRTKRPEMGQIADQMADVVLVTSDNPRTEDPLEIIDHVLEGVGRKDQLHVIPDRKTAIHKALSLAEPGDVVLIAGKGHETYQEINGVRSAFDDRLIAKSYLDHKE